MTAASPATPRRIVYLRVRHPEEQGEEFLRVEVAALRRLTSVLEVPIRPRTIEHSTDVWSEPLLSSHTIRSGLHVAVRHPIAVSAAILSVIDARRPLKSVRNLAVIPKALALARIIEPGDVLYAAWLSTPATVAMVASTITGVPWAASAHRGDIREAGSLGPKLRRARFIRVIAVDAEQELLRRAPREAPAAIRMLHLGIEVPAGIVDLDSCAPLRVLAVGALIPRKNQRTLLRALAEPGGEAAQLSLAGEGPSRRELLALARSLGVLERVEFLGHVDHDVLLQRLDVGDWNVVTLASTSEGIPVALMEALARGIPVVASDVGGTGELVSGAGGTLVSDPFDASAFASAWRREREAWSPASAERAQAFVRSEFDAGSIAAKIVGLFTDPKLGSGPGSAD